ncbi:hypothetical protein Vadar_019919 [Vaccinium darrowii]|uniref:Uncharacterized protein n=1 Tax=Vaccinium darrowii TaxID=229202 RepID=A0ACB7XIP7_9ERIC|nr:hypothetical protein Vadar_019919 [Vaccinium darrowii]
MAINGDDEKPLQKISEAFIELANTVKNNSQTSDQEVGVQLETAPFSHACSLVSPLFGCLGIAFKFAEMDYVAKVHDLGEAAKSLGTLQIMIDQEVEANCVRKAGSHTRNLLRVKRGLDMVRVLFEQIIATEFWLMSLDTGLKEHIAASKPYGNSLKNAASTAYAQALAPYHGWAIRKAVAAGMYALPTKAQLLKRLNEDGE